MRSQSLLHEQVERAVDDGARLDEVEADVIEPAAVSPEQRDALWLYAWGLLDGDEGFGQRFSR